MSTLSAWSYVEGPCTIWPTGGTDAFGQPIGGAPYLIPAIDYEFGGDVQRDETGTEFVPRITIYFEAAFDSELVPHRARYLKLGDHVSLAAQRCRAYSHGAGLANDQVFSRANPRLAGNNVR